MRKSTIGRIRRDWRATDRDGAHVGYQIGHQDTYVKLLLLDALTGFRADRR